MLRCLIIFLIRIRLGLKKYQDFRFDNQKSKKDSYYFNDCALMKIEHEHDDIYIRESSVSLNWLLSDYCKIHTLDDNPNIFNLKKDSR